MTYKELVDSIGETVNNHLILKDFGYGALTDIKTVDADTRVDYPYAFLNPTQSSRTGQSITYRFNLIVMDVVQEDPTNGYANYLKVQSACQQYIDDILANLRFSKPYRDFDLTLNVNLTPFKERFQDTVAGMTATLEIEVPYALNNCIAPVLDRTLITYSLEDQVREPDPFGAQLATDPPAVDPYDLYKETGYYGSNVYIDKKAIRIVMEGTAQFQPGTGVQVTQAPQLQMIQMISNTPAGPAGGAQALFPQDTTWPNSYTEDPFTFQSTYVVEPTPYTYQALLWILQGGDPADEYAVRFENTTIKIYELQ